MFSIDHCKNNTASGIQCAYEEEIHHFLKDLTIEGWSIENHLDFMSFGHEPIFKIK